jgi:uncharacterized protein (DUF2235 family)
MKHIVICCDGTGNQYGDANSNVVKLYQALKRDADHLTAYYHPGVGTMGAKNALTATGKAWTKFRGLAFGYGLAENITDAYRYLMQTFEPGDRIFIFGFSRGAYTARALCGMLEMLGLLAPGAEGQIPYAMRLFKRREGAIFSGLRPRSNKFEIAKGFQHTFCRECKPYFLGLWDTVSSVGWILDPIGLKPGGLPYTYSLGGVSIIRHALAIDERRAFFRQNLVEDQAGRDIKQVWFAGVHSDVGGSYQEAESGLSKISLSWMLREAQGAGLEFNPARIDDILGGDGAHAKPLANAVMHNSLTFAWWLGEFWPKFTKRRVSPVGVYPARFRGHPRMNLFRRRYLPNGARIHASVFTRKALVAGYAARNLPENFTREPDSDTTSPYPVRLNIGDAVCVAVFARAAWNDTTVEVRQGETYALEAIGTWYDASISCGPEGYASPSLGFRLAERWRRSPGENWFALTGAIGQDQSAAFALGARKEVLMPQSGVLYCYANDLPFTYRNNSGSLKVNVKRIS